MVLSCGSKFPKEIFEKYLLFIIQRTRFYSTQCTNYAKSVSNYELNLVKFKCIEILKKKIFKIIGWFKNFFKILLK